MDIKNINVMEIRDFDLSRRVVSHMTSTSWRNIPHAVFIYEPDITVFCSEMVPLYKKGITFNTVMLKVITEGLMAAPVLNSCLEYDHRKAKGRLYICRDINISVPWLLPDGRMIPLIVPQTNRKTLKEISNHIKNIKYKIENTNIDEMLCKTVYTDTIKEIMRFNFGVIWRILSTDIRVHKKTIPKTQGDKKYNKMPKNEGLTHKDMLNGTVTVSNIGSLYKELKGSLGLLEIIPPQILAIGIGAIQEKPGVYSNATEGKKIGIRKTVSICIAFDHRAVDFNDLIPFLKKLDEIFEKPGIIQSW